MCLVHFAWIWSRCIRVCCLLHLQFGELAWALNDRKNVPEYRNAEICLYSLVHWLWLYRRWHNFQLGLTSRSFWSSFRLLQSTVRKLSWLGKSCHATSQYIERYRRLDWTQTVQYAKETQLRLSQCYVWRSSKRKYWVSCQTSKLQLFEGFRYQCHNWYRISGARSKLECEFACALSNWYWQNGWNSC